MRIYEPGEDSVLLSDVLRKKIPEMLKFNFDLMLLEIGSGSGFQLQKILGLGIKKKNIFCCDVNPEAVKKCRNLGFNCMKSNLFKKFKGKKFDVIIFNPPYLPEDKDEPKESQVATTGGKFGSDIINRFLEEAGNHLEKNGRIFLIISSLTKKINWKGYRKILAGKKKLFFEEIYCWELVV
jgi:release factor glutamine methyltransferase